MSQRQKRGPWRSLVLVLGLALVAGLGLSSCSSHSDPWAKAGARKRVVVTFAPLESFVKKVGGEHVAVVCLATEKGPHDYNYNPKEAIAVRGAHLLVANGLGLDDSYADKLNWAAANKNLRYVKLGHELEELDEKKKDKLLIALKKVAGKKAKHDHDDEPGHHHDHEGEWDPHIWLGFASTVPPMIDEICEQLTAIDQDHAADFKQNAADFKKELVKMGSDAQKALADKKDRRLITFHDSLRYLARDLKLEIVETIQIAPGESPTSERYKNLINLCKDRKIKYIATERHSPETQAKKIKDELKAKDVDVKVFRIDPLETADPKELNADWYKTQMEKIIETLKDELE